MIRLGLRLALGSGREALQRVVVVAAAVALGSGLLLVALAGINGLHAQAARGAWLNSAAQGPPSTAGAGLWWLSSVDQFRNQAIDRVDVAAAGPSAPVPPGIPRLPGPGQYYASPALAALLRSVPRDELAARYPGHEVGTIGAAALPSPNSLVIVIGHTAGDLARAPGATEVAAIQRTLVDCLRCSAGSESTLQWILAGGAIALLLPILILIATASRLSATRREERFAAMRLVGATPRQVAVVAAVEAAVAAAVGVVGGFVLFFAFRPLLVHVPFSGAPFAPGDLSLTWADAAVVAIGVPVASALSARLALRRVRISPLGVARRASAPPPRATRALPLLLGVGVLAYFAAAGKPGSNGGQVLELLVGFVLIVVGLVLGGPWLTTAGSRLLARRARRPAALLAGRRLLDNPKGSFRFISGLVLALFVASAAVGALSSIAAAGAIPSGSAARSTVVDAFCSYVASPCPPGFEVPSVPSRTLEDLRATPGVRGVTVVHQSASAAQFGSSVVACSQLRLTPAVGRCEPGAATAAVGFFLSNLLGHHGARAATTWPSSDLPVAALDRLPVDAVVVATDGTTGAFEAARTALERAFPYESFEGSPVAVDALVPSTARILATVQVMTDVVIVASLIIAACSLAVNVAAGLGERRRPFRLLRLTGVPTAILRRVIAIESAMPLLFVSAVSVAVGLLSSALYLHSQVDIALRLPGLSYWATVLAGLAASLAIIASTFPILDRITAPDAVRSE